MATSVPALKKIPETDQRGLYQFFWRLFQTDSFAYTLFGNKPITICDYQNPLYYSGSSLSQLLIFEKGWKLWSKYQHFFPSDNFVFKRCKYKNEIITLYLVNKRSVLNVISKNIDLFEAKYGVNFSPQKFLERLCDPNIEFGQQQIPEELFGILLGFGRENAIAFARESKIAAALKISVAQELSEELRRLQEKKKGFRMVGEDDYLEFLAPLGFAIYDESSELLHNYEKTRKLIHRAYRNTSFLDVTIDQWMKSHEE